jgi:hypothetical protein
VHRSYSQLFPLTVTILTVTAIVVTNGHVHNKRPAGLGEGGRGHQYKCDD